MSKGIATSTLVWVIFALITLLVVIVIMMQAKTEGGHIITNFFDVIFS